MHHAWEEGRLKKHECFSNKPIKLVSVLSGVERKDELGNGAFMSSHGRSATYPFDRSA